MTIPPRFSGRLALALMLPATLPANVGLAATVEIGPRPLWLADSLPEGELRDALADCDLGDIAPSPFSIGHRGAPLQFPEHTVEGYTAAARMGAGIVECDVTFTRDRELVCRHSQCDLHTTTDILDTELAGRCSVPPDMNSDTPFAEVQCCTSDITLAEFRTLHAKMDAGNPEARTLDEYLDSTARFRTDLYADRGTLLTHAESIALFDQLGVGMTPELKEALVELPFDGDYTRTDQADRMLQEYRDAGIDPSRVWPQSFESEDIDHWLASAPDFADQVVHLEDRYNEDGFDHMDPATWTPSMQDYADAGQKYLAPPLWMLVTTDEAGDMVPSEYAKAARAAGLKLIAWSLERSGPLSDGGDWYYQSVTEATDDESATLVMLDVLARDVGVEAVFSDWPATTTYYAHCLPDVVAR